MAESSLHVPFQFSLLLLFSTDNLFFRITFATLTHTLCPMHTHTALHRFIWNKNVKKRRMCAWRGLWVNQRIHFSVFLYIWHDLNTYILLLESMSNRWRCVKGAKSGEPIEAFQEISSLCLRSQCYYRTHSMLSKVRSLSLSFSSFRAKKKIWK